MIKLYINWLFSIAANTSIKNLNIVVKLDVTMEQVEINGGENDKHDDEDEDDLKGKNFVNIL